MFAADLRFFPLICANDFQLLKLNISFLGKLNHLFVGFNYGNKLSNLCICPDFHIVLSLICEV